MTDQPAASAPDGRPLTELHAIELETELTAARLAVRYLRRRVRPGVKPPAAHLIEAAQRRCLAAEHEAQRRNWF